jgi:hypothetical protein
LYSFIRTDIRRAYLSGIIMTLLRHTRRFLDGRPAGGHALKGV